MLRPQILFLSLSVLVLGGCEILGVFDEGPDAGAEGEGEGEGEGETGDECGNGINELTEECDHGEFNVTGQAALGDCRDDCTEAVCGDGIIDDGEDCDDTDTCATDCGVDQNYVTGGGCGFAAGAECFFNWNDDCPASAPTDQASCNAYGLTCDYCSSPTSSNYTHAACLEGTWVVEPEGC